MAATLTTSLGTAIRLPPEMEQLQYRGSRLAGSRFAVRFQSECRLPIVAGMARGWESKSVEAQQEEASRAELRRRATTPEQLALEDRRRTLELMRTRAGDDLSRATVAAHRHMLEQAIASLDTELARLRTSER